MSKDRRRAKKADRYYSRQMLRSAFVSMIQSVVESRRANGYTLQQLADDTDNNKSTVSRWFSDERPNWQLDTISDIAEALNIDLVLRVRDRETGAVHSPQGIVTQEAVTRGNFQVYRMKRVAIHGAAITDTSMRGYQIDVPVVYRSSGREQIADVSIKTLQLP